MSAPTSARDRLLVAAGRLFYDAGLTATGVEAVVRAAGVSKPTLYAHFESKAELVAAVLDLRRTQRAAELEAWVDRTEARRDRPLAVFAWLADWYRRDGHRGCAFLNAAAEVIDPADPARVVVAQEKRWLCDYLVGLARDGGLRAPEQLGSQLLLLIDGVSARVLTHGIAAAADAVRDATVAARLLTAAASGSDAA